ncbi:MAG: tripartite tricarboxylate transporter substrate binding protein [Betaproteobacteria bacterium]|nr:tripartite tricarboxylate transporter substrate binding protein [Betaproteobacteria bacterium]
MSTVMSLRALFALLLLATSWVHSSVASAQPYPDRPLRIYLSFGPGGGSDIQARLIGQKLTERLGQPVIVDNRAGGNGLIGMRAAATSKPDGYTLYWGSSDHVIMGPSNFTNYPFDPLRDFIPVAQISSQPYIIVVPAAIPAKSLTDFISLAKSKPGQFNFGSTGTGGLAHLAGEVMQKATGIKMVHVPFKGAAEVNTALMGEHVQLQFAGVATVTPLIRSGAVRPLGVTSARRLPGFPELPTAVEAGFPDLVIASWNGLFAPAGTPPDIVRTLQTVIAEALRNQAVLERLSSLGLQAASAPPSEFAGMVKSELDKWEGNMRSFGIEKVPL